MVTLYPDMWKLSTRCAELARSGFAPTSSTCFQAPRAPSYRTSSYGTRCPSRGSLRTHPAATSRASARDTFPTAIPSALAISDVVATAPSSASASAAELKARTLTNLYNRRPTWLDLAHRKLDEAVFAAYGWPGDLGDEEILARLLQLNLERAATGPAK